MKRRLGKFVILLCCVLNTTACTTAKAIKETGNEFSQGNIITGLWYGTMGITMAALIDVVTLGGTTDVTTGSKALIAAANSGRSYSGPSGISSYSTAKNSNAIASTVTQRAYTTYGSSRDYATSSNTSNSNVSNNAQASSYAGSSSRYSVPMTNCVSSKVDQSKSDNYGTYYRLTNTCQVRISVTHYVNGTTWGGHQGKGDLNPGQSTTTVKVPTGSRITYRACEIPAGKEWVGIENTNGGGFMCVIYQ